MSSGGGGGGGGGGGELRGKACSEITPVSSNIHMIVSKS